jgi:hypothetical protein
MKRQLGPMPLLLDWVQKHQLNWVDVITDRPRTSLTTVVVFKLDIEDWTPPWWCGLSGNATRGNGLSRAAGNSRYTPSMVTLAAPIGRASPPSVALGYWGRLRRRSHSPRAERIKVKPPSPPRAQRVQTKKNPPGDLAISP